MVEFAGVAPKIWFDGELVPAREAKLHVLSGAVKYGATVFEGICAYRGAAGGLAVFRLPEHVERMREGMRLMRFEHDWSEAFLTDVVLETLRANGLDEDAHLRLSAYVTNEGFLDARAPVTLACLAVRRHAGDLDAKAVRAQVSSWRRIDDQSMPPRLKCAANYHNGRLATIQARAEGYDEAILLTTAGKVSESAGSCIMAVRNGVVLTPTVTGGILESVTRATLIELFRDQLGAEVVERDVDRTELYACDEAFLCGSGYEVTPIVSVDGLDLGDGGVGPVTRAVFEAYDAATRGATPACARWLTPV